MSDRCPACEKREHVYSVQMQGREAARMGLARDQNPHDDRVDAQYWEYGWIEENFLKEIEEHRAVMSYAGEHIFQLSGEIVKKIDDGLIADQIGEQIIASLSTVAGKLAEKLRGS